MTPTGTGQCRQKAKEQQYTVNELQAEILKNVSSILLYPI